MTDVSKQLGLVTIQHKPFTTPVDAQLGIGTYAPEFLNFSLKNVWNSATDKLRSADYRETGKLGRPNDATLKEAKDRAYAQYPESISKKSPDEIQAKIDAIQLDIDQAYSQLGERKTSFGALIGKDYKGTGTCGSDHACMNRALATIKEYEDRLKVLKQNYADALTRTTQSANSTIPETQTTPGKSNWLTYTVFGVTGIVVIASIIAIVKKVKKG